MQISDAGDLRNRQSPGARRLPGRARQIATGSGDAAASEVFGHRRTRRDGHGQGGSVTGTFGGVGRQHVACMKHQSHLDDPEGHEEQQRAHQHELDDRSALLIAAAPGSLRLGGRRLSP